MTEQAKVPAIRFAGFTDPWEQRKFVDFVEASGIRNKDNLQLESYSVSNDRGFVPQDEQFENGGTMRDADKTAYWIVEPGSFAYNPARINVGSIGYQSTRKNVIVSSLYEVFKTDRSCDDRFLWHWFKSSLFTKQIEMLQEGGVRLYFFFDKLQKSEIWMPNVDEQRIIGQQFDQLDSLITLHQRKYDKLVVFKKSMLEKMFPKDGESVPEIRFAGFTDPWEQRKLGELEKDATLYMGRGRVISAKDMSNTPGTFPVYSSSALDNGRMGAYGKYMFNQELITWSIDGGGAVFYRRKHRFSVTNVSGYIAVNPEKINCKFLAYAMSLAHSRIKFDYTVKAHPSVIRSLYTMGIPISLQEQQVIGSFFSRLDNLITLHQRKLELLQNIKKSLLDKMFV
ncbi:restriction endonuclease subunit S [Bifidobacterium bifidum]|uniref:Putative type I restriction enzyme specificity protein n=2 Tax=Bifidobacterium bifidum TaxID=1681 RepID=I3WIF7_BIFBI|nr:putative type I restriction enzyme specificity protein [Bifidobacterium bifidum BGN4]